MFRWTQRRKTAAMMGCRTQNGQRKPVMGGGVAAVGFPAEPRVAIGEAHHQPIPRHLSNDGRCSDRKRRRIATDHQPLRAS